jgi:hypothetical protein
VNASTVLINQIGKFTLDNASNNDAFMRFLGMLLKAEGIQFEKDGNRVW